MDHIYLRRAIELAALAERAGGRPFGALLVMNGEIVSEANRLHSWEDPTKHPEIEVIRDFCQRFQASILGLCTLYTNVEPCPMCAGAIFYSRVNRLVFSVSRLRFDDLIASLRKRPNRKYLNCREILDDGSDTAVTGPLIEEEGMAVLQAHPFHARFLEIPATIG